MKMISAYYMPKKLTGDEDLICVYLSGRKITRWEATQYPFANWSYEEEFAVAATFRETESWGLLREVVEADVAAGFGVSRKSARRILGTRILETRLSVGAVSLEEEGIEE